MNYQPGEKKSNIKPQEHAQPLIDFINQMYPLSDELIDFVNRNTHFKKVAKGKFLLKPGEICDSYYFISKGVLRSYLKFGTKEVTVWINPENEITTAIRSMSTNTPAQEYIQVIEDAELVVIPYQAMKELYETFPEMNMVGRVLLEEYYAASEERLYICKIPDAQSRYKHFNETRPELVNRIPLKYVASYLGITLETLSRLRARRPKKNQ